MTSGFGSPEGQHEPTDVDFDRIAEGSHADDADRSAADQTQVHQAAGCTRLTADLYHPARLAGDQVHEGPGHLTAEGKDRNRVGELRGEREAGAPHVEQTTVLPIEDGHTAAFEEPEVAKPQGFLFRALHPNDGGALTPPASGQRTGAAPLDDRRLLAAPA